MLEHVFDKFRNVWMSVKNQERKKPWWLNTPVLYTAMILLGVLSGFSDIPVLKATGLFVADVFIRIFKCISLPIIALSIIVTLAHYRSEGIMKRVWRRTMCYTLGTTLVAASIVFIDSSDTCLHRNRRCRCVTNSGHEIFRSRRAFDSGKYFCSVS